MQTAIAITDYKPQIGYSVSYPFDGGSAQNCESKMVLGFSTGGLWRYDRQLDQAEALQLTGGTTPNNKVALVISRDEHFVKAVYHCDGKFRLIRLSYDNVASRPGIRVHDQVGTPTVELWCGDTAEQAVQATIESVAILGRDKSRTVEAIDPLPVPPRFERGSSKRVFVPCAKIGDATGKIAFNFDGEPIGVWTADNRLVS